jgi:hypothetical protein
VEEAEALESNAAALGGGRVESSSMPIMLNTVLRGAGVDPEDVRLLRHQDQRSELGRTPYELWRDDRPAFESYQSLQRIEWRLKFSAKYWASFVGTSDGGTLFVGLFAVRYLGLLKEDRPMPHTADVDEAGSRDEYELAIQSALQDLAGRLCIAWGDGTRAWVQYADRRDKPVVEIRRTFSEPEFPGFLEFREPLSRVEGLPKGWVEVLRSSRGVYLLTCPKTKEQYVGSATGEECFWQRWLEYVRTGHGGNVALKSRDPSDYQVSILEVAGTAATTEDIFRMEGRWQRKLQSREMGLNKNVAGA